ncbi:Hydroxynaphthalene reductase-like protein Arp2 [Fulvia fulva]|uniref:Hydroxynaphthalene reductase-like protein Arp2 n=1 Tax=Passalora fulva TaxID=5499 RepID=A0A9Q8LFN0_PASFU|nr:Hydroxynaphthalene reductase-like protein Arp2 [Fulvia fulva]KAK4615590.1 Hydroxynaphthalene reductase-like protein Arp2 [Fulvia fulva]KAK4616859.1 Hydroxynaphthalene reductase-like protein Arp2 [Fulvia fulva]UJO16525.1 Hydroxynaphthalene reductase-like protein Arp2 [Fulvia fulva]WPV18989.1 Hydroxynaphthalene reductase-like protein Arp2 [Fulvia fulva]WPV34239.1 Hydroxynaphthalene reductase-like protein Arp2 [Fulvia fulva]
MKIAIVTGTARGIGRGIVIGLAEQGTKVVFNYTSPSSAAAAEDLCHEVSKIGSRALSIKGDITDQQTHRALVKIALQIFDVQGLDILVNNAGAGDNKLLEDVTIAHHHHLMDAFLPFVNPGGRIINVSSISARGGYATQSVYAASKAAVEGLTKVWATELGPKYNITVNCMNPGAVDTDMYRAAGEVHLARMEAENRKTPARWVTGDTVCANGGMLFL